jgi:NitT/TauT family transport system substrate-binding protein
MATEMSAPEIATIGLGAVDNKRLSKSIDILVDAEKLPTTPKVSQIFDAAYLPPVAVRPKSMSPRPA